MIPDEHDPLEARLRALRPTGLPSGLQTRLLAVEPPPVRHRSLRRLLPLVGSLAVTATVLLLVALAAPHRHPSPAQAGSPRSPIAPTPPSDYRVFVPTGQRSTLLGVSEGEVVDTGAEPPVRLVRAVWLDDTTYVGADHSTVHRRTTRTEVVPVSLESF